MKWFAAEWFICGVHHSLEIRCMFWGAIASPLTSECHLPVGAALVAILAMLTSIASSGILLSFLMQSNSCACIWAQIQ